jgi:Lrp/AsnC family leucine-responsive transcriptional regulator
MKPARGATGDPGSVPAPPPRFRLDDVDLKILSYLVEDARISQRAIARAVGMSAPSVADRINRLEAAGVIQGYHATLNYGALERPMTVVIEVQSERSSTQPELAKRLVEMPEVERVDIVTGSTDLQLRLRVRDQAHLNEVLFNNLLLASTDIRHTETYLCLTTEQPDSFDGRLLDTLAQERAAQADGDEGPLG